MLEDNASILALASHTVTENCLIPNICETIYLEMPWLPELNCCCCSTVWSAPVTDEVLKKQEKTHRPAALEMKP